MQPNICALNFHTNQQQETVILSSAASAAVAGGSWQLVYPTSGKGVPVPYQPIALRLYVPAFDSVGILHSSTQCLIAIFNFYFFNRAANML